MHTYIVTLRKVVMVEVELDALDSRTAEKLAKMGFDGYITDGSLVSETRLVSAIRRKDEKEPHHQSNYNCYNPRLKPVVEVT